MTSLTSPVGSALKPSRRNSRYYFPLITSSAPNSRPMPPRKPFPSPQPPTAGWGSISVPRPSTPLARKLPRPRPLSGTSQCYGNRCRWSWDRYRAPSSRRGMGLDIGPKTIDTYCQKIASAKTIVWNGPMGVFEMPAFAKGTLEVAKAVAAATSAGATSIVGGGDSVAAVHQSGVSNQISHISTGGGASLELLRGRKLPGVEALTNK